MKLNLAKTKTRSINASYVRVAVAVFAVMGIPSLMYPADDMYMDELLNKAGIAKMTTTVGSSVASSTAKCTEEQLSVITKMLPNKIHIQRSTKCPGSTWMTDGPWLSNLKKENEPLVSIYVGCNKGMDAVNTLRMFSHDAKYEKQTWKRKMNITTAGACRQLNTPQFKIKSESQPRPAHVYCIEAMPTTFQKLKSAVEETGWSDALHLHHIAMADTDGVISFPNLAVGTEHLGMWACDDPQWSKTCQNVTKTSLDSFATSNVPESWMIDFLSVDVEGNDWPVLKGGSHVLSRTKYVEFEHHWNGVWAYTNISIAIDFLASLNFVCYWAGKGGKLWRITECYRDDYNKIKAWSNLACASLDRAPELADRMEQQFLQTLENHSKDPTMHFKDIDL